MPGRIIASFAALFFLLAPGKAIAGACADLGAAVDRAPSGPVLLASFPTAPAGPLQNTAFLYDNAVAAIALVGCGERLKAARIADAILYAQRNDRHYTDGRLRNAYAAGAMSNGKPRLAGWWDDKNNAWLEDSYQAASDTGNMAWAMLALLALDRPELSKYRDGAARIGRFLLRFQDRKSPGGYRGGTHGHEPAAWGIGWKSTEHNADIAGAFLRLSLVAKDPQWKTRAEDASRFVGLMWNSECACFAAGTREDGATKNPVIALDAQAWPLMALPDAAKNYAVGAATWTRLRVRGGFTYADGGTGLWTEGTAQMAVLFSLLGRDEEAASLLKSVERQRAPGGLHFATDAETLSTGFMSSTDSAKSRVYYRLPHLGATGWAALAERRFNPFTATRALP